MTNWKFWNKKEPQKEPIQVDQSSLVRDFIEWKKEAQRLDLEYNRGAGIS